MSSSFVRVLALNALLAYPLLFLVYKHFDPQLTPMDIPAYMAMVEDKPTAADPPYRYRVLAPLAVKAMRPLPAYPIPVAFTEDPDVRKDVFHFMLLNFALNLLVSGLVFVYLKDKVKPAFAWLGSCLYLFSFYAVMTNIIPMTDASCHLALIACILLFERQRPAWFALACLIGVFTKETLLVVLLPWIALASLRDRRRLAYLAYALPAVAAYLAATRLWPAESPFAYYQPSFLLGNLFNAFRPGLYDVHLVFQVFLAHLPLLACLAAWAFLKLARKPPVPGLPPELALFPFLVWLGITMDVGNNSGRMAFMAFPAILLFQTRVLEALAGGRQGAEAPAEGA